MRGDGTVFTRTVRVERHGKVYTYERWVAQETVRDEDGRRRYITGTGATREEAVRRRNANRARRMAAGRRARSHGITVEDWLSEWLQTPMANGRLRKPQTCYEHENRYRNQIRPHIHGPISSVTSDQLRTFFYTTLVDAGPSTRVNAYKTLSALFKAALEEGHIDTNPMLGVKKPYAESVVNQTDVKYADKRATIARYMLDWLPTSEHAEHFPLVALMLLGLRRSELLGLTHDCFSKSRLTIKQQLMRHPDGHYFIQPTTKTNRVRTIELAPLWRNALKQQQAVKRVAVDDWASDLLFLQPNGKPYTYNAYNRIWRTVLSAYMTKGGRKMREDDYWRPHSNRKVTASILASTGVPVQTAMDILGHASEAMTVYYATLSREAQREGIQRLASGLTR